MVRIRFFLITGFIGLAIVLWLMEGWSTAWPLLLAATFLLVTHLLFGGVWVALHYLKQGKIDQAERILSAVWRPDWLMRPNRAYYHFALGLIYLQHRQLDKGENQLLLALGRGLVRPNDRALAKLNLAHVQYIRSNPAEAHTWLQQAREEEPTDLMLKEQLTKLEQALDHG